MGDTTIAWTDKTWNPTTGCSKVSQGCKNCYAERIFHRPYPGRAFTDVRTHPDRLFQPLKWKKPQRIFVNSMSDLFHEDVPDDFLHSVFAVMAQAPQHTFQVLTKRPGRMLSYLLASLRLEDIYAVWHGTSGGPAEAEAWPLPNVWLGVSVEDQATAVERINTLLSTPAAVRFVSYEPALGPVDFSPWLKPVDVVRPDPHGRDQKLDWVIVGGESGPKARPFDLDWASRAIYQCKTAGVPVFFKQYGSCPIFEGERLRLKDRSGADPAEWLDCFRVQEFPQ